MVKTSIVIPTFNGANKILNILHALKNQTYRDFEVIVVIDGSTDNTKELIKEFKYFSVNVYEQENKGRAAVRNIGAAEATGDILIFFDDDMRPLPTCVEEHINQHLQAEADIIVVGVQQEDEKIMKTDVQRYKAHLSKKWLKPLQNKQVQFNKENLFLTAANFSLPKNLFYAIGGFDERLTDAEDYDLGIRALQMNVPIFFNHKALAWHDDFITAASYIKRQKQYKLAHQKLLILKPDLYKKPKKQLISSSSNLKAFIYNFFKSKFWVACIDNNFMRFFPKSLRYKLYDIIIHASSISK